MDAPLVRSASFPRPSLINVSVVGEGAVLKLQLQIRSAWGGRGFSAFLGAATRLWRRTAREAREQSRAHLSAGARVRTSRRLSTFRRKRSGCGDGQKGKVLWREATEGFEVAERVATTFRKSVSAVASGERQDPLSQCLELESGRAFSTSIPPLFKAPFRSGSFLPNRGAGGIFAGRCGISPATCLSQSLGLGPCPLLPFQALGSCPALHLSVAVSWTVYSTS